MEKKITYTVSNYILDRLKELGAEHFFEVPGDYASPFLNTLDNDKQIKRIPNINELGVGYATDGYGRFKGVAACSVQYGVGTFCILNCFAGGLVERVPMVLIGPAPTAKNVLLTNTKGVLFHHSTGDLNADKLAMENATILSIVISENEGAHELIDHALKMMITYSRPVYIEVWQNVFAESCPKPKGKLKTYPKESDEASLQSLVESAWKKICQSKLPVIWAGVEIQRYRLQGLLQKIIDASGFYFTTTSLGKTILDESQQPFIGTYAGPASPALTRAVMLETDCLICTGTIITDDYLDIMGSGYELMIEVNDELARIGYATYEYVQLKDFLEALLKKIKGDPSFPRKYGLPIVLPDPVVQINANDPLSYERFYSVLGNWLIEEKNIRNAKLILGESTSLYVFGNLMGMPADSFVAQAAWGSLGHETGCALGVELATGHRPLVVAGDGGFMMICQEISSLVRQKSNAVIFVMSNKGYAIEQAFVSLDAFKPGGSYAPFDLLPTWDYIALAKAFGAKGVVVKTVGGLKRLLKKLEKKDGIPTLVEVVIPLKDLPPQLKRLATPPPPPK
jgi:indolepyruvate decarboxylase